MTNILEVKVVYDVAQNRCVSVGRARSLVKADACVRGTQMWENRMSEIG